MLTAQATATAALNAVGALHNSGTLVFYNGTAPATPETALSSNTVLCTCDYATTAFGTPTYVSPNMQATASFTGSPFTPAVNGGTTFARALESGGATCIAQYTVGQAWAASNVTAVGQYCTNGGNSYVCTSAGTTAASGGPTGTSTGITDGTVTWNYVGSGTLFDVTLGNVNLQTGVQVTPTQTLLMAAS